jgi:dUTP pyrophosphatase
MATPPSKPTPASTLAGLPIKLKFVKMHPAVQLPRNWSAESVGYDVHAFLLNENGRESKALVPPRAVANLHTGLMIEPPKGHFVMVCSRSGLAKQSGIFVANAPGIVDPDYRGELRVLLYNGGFQSHYVQHNDRIAQLVVVPAVSVVIEEVPKLSETVRGEAGLGSTGT